MSSIQNINNNQHELQEYILGLTQQTDKNSIISILNNDLNQYQKAYVDTLVGKFQLHFIVLLSKT